jgi:iron complex transport system ATP-binding protein
MVLAQDTAAVLLDEPLNNLDMKHAVGTMQLLRRAAAELSKTIVVVLHDINFASVYSDYIVCMHEGRVAYRGAPADVITPEIMRAVYEIDVKVHLIGGQLISVYYG